MGFNLFNGLERKREFSEMGVGEKRKFLSVDLIDRMIRIEQRVSASFGSPIIYFQTEYYKQLSPSEKEEFKAYFHKKNRPKFYFLFLIASLFLLGTHIMLTGNSLVNVSVTAFNIFDFFIFGLFFVFLALWLFFVSKEFKHRKKEKHFKSKILHLLDHSVGHKKHH